MNASPTTTRQTYRTAAWHLRMLVLLTAIHVPGLAQKPDASAAKCGQVVQRTEQAVVRILGIPKSRLQPELRLVEDLGANDQHLPSLTMALEDAFLIELPDELAEDSGTTMKSYIGALHKALRCADAR